MIDNKVVGLAIGQLRQAENMTQQTLAACLNVSHQAVSKWENGAALPDVLTLLEISRMFGVTLEQLLAGDIKNRLEKSGDAKTAGEKPRVIELKLDGNGLSGRVNDAIKDAEAATQGSAQNADEPREAKSEGSSAEEAPVDMDKIVQMAPFMSKAALEELLDKYSGKCTPRQLSRLAPFVSSEYLERLIVNSESEINWDTLRRLAPFLKKEVVDSLTLAVAKGEKYVRPAAKTLSKSITFGINKAIEFAKSVGAQIPDMDVDVNVNAKKKPPAPPEAPKAPSRASEARKRIFERALADGKFDWIAEHMEQLDDAELKAKIAARARELGKNDWVQAHMGDVWDQATIDDAILAGNWDYISEHIDEIDPDTIEMVVTTALGEGRWDWLGEHIDELTAVEDSIAVIVEKALEESKWDWLGEHIDELADAEDSITAIVEKALEENNWDWLGAHIDELELYDMCDDIAMKAYLAGQRDLVIDLVDEHADEMDLEALLIPAIEKDDFDFVTQIIEHAEEDVINAACLKLAKAGQIDRAAELAENCDEDTLAQLIEIATEAGDWGAIEKLNEFLD